MPRYDVVDEAIIDADSSAVFKALLDSYAGVSSWWMPYFETKLRGDEKTIQKGSVFDITVRHRRTSKFAGRIMEIVENKLIKYEYFEADFIGTGEWTLESLDGKTRVRFRWNTKSKRFLLTLLSPFINLAKIHSEVMQLGFKGLNKYLSQK